MSTIRKEISTFTKSNNTTPTFENMTGSFCYGRTKERLIMLVLYATIDNEPKVQIKIHFAKEHLSQEDNLHYDGQAHGFIHIEIVDFDLLSKAQEEFYTRLTMVNTKAGNHMSTSFS